MWKKAIEKSQKKNHIKKIENLSHKTSHYF